MHIKSRLYMVIFFMYVLIYAYLKCHMFHTNIYHFKMLVVMLIERNRTYYCVYTIIKDL